MWLYIRAIDIYLKVKNNYVIRELKKYYLDFLALFEIYKV